MARGRMQGTQLIWLAAAIWTAASCAGGTSRLAPEMMVFYPPPPDTARVQFLTSFSSSRDLQGGRSFWDIITGSSEDRGRAIAKPYGLAIRDGHVYVCDTPINGVVIVDLQNGDFEFFQPLGQATIGIAANCYVDHEGLLYVADPGRNQVAIYRQQEMVASLSEDGWRPGDVFVTADRILVSNMRSGRVRVYDRTSRTFQYEFPGPEPDTTEQLAAPANLYVQGDRVYVSDALGGRVQVYTLEGEHVQSIGAHGTGFGQFARPKGVAVDRNGIVYVVDAAFQNVQLFNPEGRLLTFIGGRRGMPGDMVLPAKVVIDYDHLARFRQYVHPDFELEHLIFVTNQYGPAKINVYGFIHPKGEATTGVGSR